MDINTRLENIKREINNIARDFEQTQGECVAALNEVVDVGIKTVASISDIRDECLRMRKARVVEKDAQIAQRVKK